MCDRHVIILSSGMGNPIQAYILRDSVVSWSRFRIIIRMQGRYLVWRESQYCILCCNNIIDSDILRKIITTGHSVAMYCVVIMVSFMYVTTIRKVQIPVEGYKLVCYFQWKLQNISVITKDSEHSNDIIFHQVQI